MLFSIFACALAAIGCTDSTNDIDDTDDADTDTPETCTETSSSITLPVESNLWSMETALSATRVLASAPTATGDLRIAIIDPDGPHDVHLIPGGAQTTFASDNAGDCAVIGHSSGMGLACEGQPFELAGEDLRIGGGSPLHVVRAADEIVTYTQTFSSFTKIVRSNAGQWTEEDQFESSISTPTDAILVEGEPMACFISAGRRAIIRSSLMEIVLTVEPAQNNSACKLAYDPTTRIIHVHTALGRAQINLDEAEGTQTTLALSPTPALDYSPHALLLTSQGPTIFHGHVDGHRLTPLDGGPVRELPRGQGFVSGFFYDQPTGAFSLIQTERDQTSSSNNIIRFTTLCM